MKTYRFTARIEAGDGGGAFVYFPYDAEKEFETTGRVPVKATLDGVPYTGSLIKYGNPVLMLLIVCLYELEHLLHSLLHAGRSCGWRRLRWRRFMVGRRWRRVCCGRACWRS